ncbi:MAG: hypothetical protein K8R34_17955 [Methanosarcinales archaeon]|nr:hypothetical protein [Methanosarcinales archaeon]
MEGFRKGDCDLRSVVDEVYDTSVLLAANGMIRTAKQLPEVSKTVVWGKAALCLAGASCDWWGGNIESIDIQGRVG